VSSLLKKTHTRSLSRTGHCWLLRTIHFSFVVDFFSSITDNTFTGLDHNKNGGWHKKQELPILREHMGTYLWSFVTPIFHRGQSSHGGDRKSFEEFYALCFVDRCLSVCTFSFCHCVVCSSSIYGFWLPLSYLQILFTITKICTSFLLSFQGRVTSSCSTSGICRVNLVTPISHKWGKDSEVFL
jgi:hypothetical protein